MADPIQSDTPCIACGYSLRGIADDTECPECGVLAVKSRLGRPLACVSTGALRWMRIGAWLMVAGMLAVFALETMRRLVIRQALFGFPADSTVNRCMVALGVASGGCDLLAAFGMGMFLWARLPRPMAARPWLRSAALHHALRLLVILCLAGETFRLVLHIRDGITEWRAGYLTLWYGHRHSFPGIVLTATILRMFVLGAVCFRIRRFASVRGNRALARWSCVAWALPLTRGAYWVLVYLMPNDSFRMNPKLVWDCCGAIFAIVIVFAAREISRELRLR